jgi:hypothetical protein
VDQRLGLGDGASLEIGPHLAAILAPFVLEEFRERADEAGRGYRTMMNQLAAVPFENPSTQELENSAV